MSAGICRPPAVQSSGLPRVALPAQLWPCTLVFFSISYAHRDAACRLVAKLQPFAGMHHLDVAGGTGDVAFRVLRGLAAAAAREQPDAEPVQDGASERRPGGVTVCDINPAMLEEGRRRAASEGHGERREPACPSYRAALIILPEMLRTAHSSCFLLQRYSRARGLAASLVQHSCITMNETALLHLGGDLAVLNDLRSLYRGGLELGGWRRGAAAAHGAQRGWLHHRLRHPQRHAHRRRPGRGASGALQLLP